MRQDSVMGLVVTLRMGDGAVLAGLTDPSGGTFDAAGDFDGLIGSKDLPVLGGLDPYGDADLPRSAIPGLLADIERASSGSSGVLTRGLQRLEHMARLCLGDSSLALHFEGD